MYFSQVLIYLTMLVVFLFLGLLSSVYSTDCGCGSYVTDFATYVECFSQGR